MTDTPTPSSKTRPLSRWLLAATTSTALCALWFAYLNRDGCWLYWRGYSGIVIFFYPWLWLFLFVIFRLQGRLILIAVVAWTALWWPQESGGYLVFSEVKAANRLRHLQLAAQAYKATHNPKEYPEELPEVTAEYTDSGKYNFEYRPRRLPDGSIGGFLIEATPRRECGGFRSFTVAEDGVLHHTVEPRAATLSDPAL